MKRTHKYSCSNSSTIKLCQLLCFMIVSAVFALSAHGQVLYGSLTGTVTDASGAVVTGAQVTALESRTGVSQTATTDTSGIYRFSNLVPGTYKVTITGPGFATQETPSVAIRANDVARIDAALKVASSTQAVTVTTEAPILQSDKGDVHTDFTAQQIEDLPIMGSQGRNFQALLRTIPGAGLTAETNSLAGNPQRAINTNMNGQSNQGNNTRIDGAQDAYPWLPANVAYVPPADAIEQVNIVTNSFDAEQGMAGGAAVNVRVKSGTNSLHGDIHEFHTDENFQSRNYFLTDKTLPGNKTFNANLQNQYGGALGGPIVKNKLFFFADYERTTQSQKAGPDARVLPTAAMASGDFTAWLPAVGSTATFNKAAFVDCNTTPAPGCIYDPMTGNATGGGKQVVTCNGVQNVICPNRFDPAAVAMVKLLQPSIAQEFPVALGSNNFQGSNTAFFNRNNADFKVDYNPGQKMTVFGRYSFSKTYIFDPPLLGAAIGDATNGGQLGNAPGLVQSVGLGATYTFTPNMLLDWNFGFTRQRLGSTFDLTTAKGLNDLKIPGTNNAGATGDPTLYYGLPGFVFPTGQPSPNTGGSICGSCAALGNAQPANPFLFRDQQFVSGANLNWIRGKHSWRGGIEWNHAQINHFQPQGGTFQEPRGAFEFNGFVTEQQGQTPTWANSWADFLFGLPSTTGKARAMFNPNALRWSQWAWYLRDQWQVNAKLTLTLGVRWEYYPFGYSDNGKGLRLLDLNTGNVLIGGYGGVPLNDHMDTGKVGQFLPRIGVAYRLDSKTVLRGGYGVSADPYQWHVLRNAYPAVILDTNIQYTGNNSDYVPAASLTGLNATGLGGGSYVVPTGIVLSPVPNVSTGVVPLPKTAGTTTFANPWQRGYINSYNFMIEHEFVRDLSFQTGYVGTYAVRPVVNLNPNAFAPGGSSINGLLSQKWGGNYTGGMSEMIPFKMNRYDSLQTKVNYRIPGGSSAGLAWTWSKAIDYADNEDLGGIAFPYPTYWDKNRALAGFDRTHNVEIWAVFAVPFGKGQRWASSSLANAIFGGWLINPIISKMSGTPFTVTGAGSGTSGLQASGTQTADLISTYHRFNVRPKRNGQTCLETDLTCHFFDPTAFAAPLICTSTNTTTCPTFYAARYGNTGRNQFRGPGYFNMNLSVMRTFKFTERVALDIRADAFGFTNTPHFANPNTSCPSSGAKPGPVPTSGALCVTGSTKAPSNFGTITSTVSPGGFFGPDPGTRTIWFGATVKF